jgi:peptidoglycan glycosyltransferase
VNQYRPRTSLQETRGTPNGLVVIGVVAVLAVVALGASATTREPEAGDELAELEAEGAPEGGDEIDDPESTVERLGPVVVAEADVPSFDALATLPAEADFLGMARVEDDRLVVDLPQGARTLTIDSRLQRRVTSLLRSYQTPYSAVAAIEPSTGRVLALAEYSHESPDVRGLPLRALYPAASIFKIVTGAALLSAGVSPEQTVCYHGGKRRLTEKLLVDDPRRDKRCATLSNAMGHSTNVIFAKLARKHLEGASLRAWAERFGFNAVIPFAQPADVSVAHIPEDGFELAATSAGFGEVRLTPLHGAMIAATIGNGGVEMAPVLFEDEASRARRVLEPAMASALADMLETTVTRGTGRRAFRERGRYVLGDIAAAGKTGTLADKKPFRDYSWFVGWAPKEQPKIAVAAVVVNGPLWRVRAPYVARETMRIFLEPERAMRQARSGAQPASRAGRKVARR